MEKQTSITKFEINEKIFYLKISWKPNENDLFHITIFDGDGTWSGHYSYAFAQKYRERLEESEEDYYDNVRTGLSNHQDFKYSFVLQPDDNNSATFSWKKKFEDSLHGLGYMVYGTVPIHRDQKNESKDTLVDFLLSENEDLRNKFDSLKLKNEQLSIDLNKCREDLMKFVDIKTNLESSLYGKFVQLLNAKKRRILLLEDSLNKIAKSNKNNNIGDELD